MPWPSDVDGGRAPHAPHVTSPASHRGGASEPARPPCARWELRGPWSNAVYCCVACYDTSGQEHDEWDISYAQTRPCTSQWPDEVLAALFGPPPPPHKHAGPTDCSVTSTHLAAHMDDAAESDSDDDADPGAD